MPALDVSDALDDFMLQDTFQVLRRLISVANTGKASSGAVQFTDIVGTVYSTKGGLQREEATEFHDKNIVVITRFPLRGASVDTTGQNFHPDIVTWSGNNFIVNDLKDWSRYGVGFVRAECTIIDMQSAPPVLTALAGAAPPPVIAVSFAGKLQLLKPTMNSSTQAALSVSLRPENMIVMRNGLPQFSPDDYSVVNDSNGNSVFTFIVPFTLTGPNADSLNIYI